ncbi:hypothetical protein JXD20_03945 [Candidatus Peregrinibacteria bacterium]|nr:hypothetical protein [Candidatus Peregrinibacteria bacterium]
MPRRLNLVEALIECDLKSAEEVTAELMAYEKNSADYQAALSDLRRRINGEPAKDPRFSNMSDIVADSILMELKEDNQLKPSEASEPTDISESVIRESLHETLKAEKFDSGEFMSDPEHFVQLDQLDEVSFGNALRAPKTPSF